MARSNCMKCGDPRFELKEMSPTGSNYKFQAIQCVACGSIAGIVDWYPVGTIGVEIKKTLAEHGEELDHMRSTVTQILDALRRRSP